MIQKQNDYSTIANSMWGKKNERQQTGNHVDQLLQSTNKTTKGTSNLS